jgi:hypothetical protein
MLHSNLNYYTNKKPLTHYLIHSSNMCIHTHTHTPICQPPQPTCSIIFHYYMIGVLVTILLFPQLTRHVNNNYLWQEMNTAFFTCTILGLCGGSTLFFIMPSQSTPLKKGCLLTLPTWLWVPNRCDGFFAKSWKEREIISTITLPSLQLCPSKLLHISQQNFHKWKCS